MIPLSRIPAFKMSQCRNTGNISVLNHEGEPIDITQATCKLCTKVTPVNVLTSVMQNVKVKKFSYTALTAHILSETTRYESTYMITV